MRLTTVFIPATLQNGFVIVGVQPFWQQVVVGAALIAAVHVDQRRRGEYAGALDAMRNDRTVHKIIIEC